MANLLLAFSLLLPLALLRALIPLAGVRRFLDRLIQWLYRGAVAMDSFWMQRVVGIELVVEGAPPPTDAACVVICNHQSWFDIPLVQEVITRHGPMVQFLIKREIVWVPIIGWICLAMNFPRLQRSQNSASRHSDLSIIRNASKNHTDQSGALLVFPEGTRFTAKKRSQQASPYQHLLKPKVGGLRVIKDHFDADASLIDITINYHQQGVKIWRCLHGNPGRISINLQHFKLGEIDDIESWLNQRWQQKDALLERVN